LQHVSVLTEPSIGRLQFSEEVKHPKLYLHVITSYQTQVVVTLVGHVQYFKFKIYVRGLEL